MEVKQTYCGDLFTINSNTVGTLESDIMLYVNYVSKKRTHH